MTTSLTPSFISELEKGKPISEGTLAYFRERQRNRIHELVLNEFLKSGLTKAEFARRIGRKPEQITRWLAAPGNWELDTVSDFLLGASGGEFRPEVTYPLEETAQDQSGPSWLREPDEKSSPPHLFGFEEQQPYDDIVSAMEAAFAGAFAQKTAKASAVGASNDNFAPARVAASAAF